MDANFEEAKKREGRLSRSVEGSAERNTATWPRAFTALPPSRTSAREIAGRGRPFIARRSHPARGLGPDQVEVGESLHALALVLLNQGDLARAEALYLFTKFA
jgi:hypothetical protein